MRDLQLLLSINLGVTETTLIISGLSNDRQYYWRVLATNSAGDSNWSAPFNFTTLPTVAGVPVLVSPSNNSTNQSLTPILSWNTVTGADSYKVQVSDDPGFSTFIVDQSGVIETTLTITGLSNDTQYYWRVLSTNSAGDSNWSTPFKFNTLPASSNTTLVAHYKMNESSGAILIDDSEIINPATLVGNPTRVAGVEGQAVRFNGSNQFAYAPQNSALNLTNKLTIAAWIKPEKRGTQYVIKKSEQNAINGYELSLSSSGKIFFRYNQATSKDTYRLDSQSSYPFNGTTWIHVAVTFDGSSIKIYLNGILNSSKSYTSAVPIAVNNMTLAIGSGNDGYRGLLGAMDDVRIYNIALTASEVNAIATINNNPSPPNAPTLNSPQNLATNVNLNPILTWNTTLNATSYNVQVSNSNNFNTTILNQSNISGTTIQLTGLTNNLTYYWRVRAANASGNSAWSEIRSFTTISTLPTIPDAPVLISPSNSATNIPVAPTLRWNSPSGTSYYAVQVAQDQSFTNLILNQTNIYQAYLDISGLLNNSNYYWRVKAINSAGESPWSIIWNFTTVASSPTGSLVAHYKLDEGAGSAISDASAYSNNAVAIGNPTWILGKQGQALRFNGTSQYGSAPDHQSLDITQQITIAAWIRPEKLGTQYLVKKADQNSTDGYELSLASNGKLFFRFNQKSSNNTYRLDSQINYPTNGNTWMHIAVTYNGTAISLYINGVLNSSKTFSSTRAINTNSLNLDLGAGANGYRGLQGALDDVRIYNVALSPAEINDVYNFTSNLKTSITSTVTKSEKISSTESSNEEITLASDTFFVYPNPFTTEANVEFSFTEDTNYILTLYDLKGMKVKDIKVGKALKGIEETAIIEASWLSKGIYLLRLESRNKAKNLRLILK